jgi:hypothetical protein
MALAHANTHIDSVIGKMRGVIGRYPHDGESYVFTWDTAKTRRVHMLGVTRPLHVSWCRDGTVIARRTLKPWIGTDAYVADMVIERRPDNS